MRKRFFIENHPNFYSEDPTELLGPLPYKRNEDYNDSHHHSLDAHKVGFKIYNGHLNSQINSSLEFDCTVRNITNLDFSIYVSFCVSHLEINAQLWRTILCALCVRRCWPDMEFDCTVRNIKNLDFSIYVSFCVSHLKINTQLWRTALCALCVRRCWLATTRHIRCQLHWSSLQTFSQLWVLSGWAGGQNSDL